MMKFKQKESLAGLVLASVLGAGSSMAFGVTWGDESGNHLKLGGYVRGWLSFNLADLPETRQDDKWDASMIRGSVSLTGNARTGPITWGAVARLDREKSTSFTDRLERITLTGDRWGANADGGPAALRAALLGLTASPGGPGSDVMDEYNQGELREFYGEANLTNRLTLRLGKQQVVWGETDFFRGMDLVHGYDMRWRSFVEPENEELRKPLIMANFMLQVPEVNGMLQAIVRPGWDRDKDIGNDYDLYGGRWDLQGFRGTDFLNPSMTMTYDRRHPDGDADDTTYGLRWRQIAGPVTYSVAYLKTFNPDPIASFNWARPLPAIALLGTPAGMPLGALLNVLGGFGGFSPCGTAKNPTALCPTTNYKGDPSSGALGEWLFPKIELLGFTATGYAPAIDSVLSTEIVYTRNAPFHTGTDFLIDVNALTVALAPLTGVPDGINAPGGLAGFKSIKKKEQLSMMFRFDKTLGWLNDLLGTSEKPFFTMQVFDK